MKIPILIGFLAMTSALLTTGCQTSRQGYETAPYRTVRTDGAFEVRDYPVINVVETAEGNADSGSSFRRLFRFISGDNERSQKIAMTTPVFMGENSGKPTMAFVLPAGMSAAEVPHPKDAEVQVRQLPAGHFAVLRYSGSRNTANEQKMLTLLQEWLAAQGLRSSAAPVYGYFDPPWTLPAFRRNEVMLRLEGPAQ
jgi:DNA gyrase inhibitor GyrI